MNTSEKPQPPDPPDTIDASMPSSSTSAQADASTSAASAAVAATVGEKKVPAKKKKVSFKFALETSDDVHIVKKEPIASFAPPVPIIKKECLTRAVRVALGGEPILMPSRLTVLTAKGPTGTGLEEKLRNNTANNIDKLNSLTFKSQVTSVTASSSSSDTDDEPNGTAHEKCDGVDTDDDDAEDDDGDTVPAKRIVRLTKESSRQANEADAGDESNVTAHDKKLDEVDEADRVADETVGGKNSGEKRFVLPKRSVHSSRVIKPNKRFMDETQASTKKNGITSRKKTNKTETSEKRLGSPPRPSTSKSSTEDMDTDAKDGMFVVLKINSATHLFSSYLFLLIFFPCS